MTTYNLENVFGVSGSEVKSYLVRDSVDGKFQAAINTDKQIIVYGASKQGKTALVSRYLSYSENVVVSLTPKMKTIDIYASVLRQSGVELEVGRSATASSSVCIKKESKIVATIPSKITAEMKESHEDLQSDENSKSYARVEMNLELPQSVFELLQKVDFDKYIILENFHYLPDEEQKSLAFDLRSYQDLGVRFVILGVWREKNRLAQFNGDILDRMVEVPVEPWHKADFKKVADAGCGFLNIHLSDSLVKGASDASFSSIGVFQEILKNICKKGGVESTAPEGQSISLEKKELLAESVQEKAEDYKVRHQRSLESIAAGYSSGGKKDGLEPLYLPYYLVKSILEKGFSGLESGMQRSSLHEAIKSAHHRKDDVRGSDMSNLLYNVGKLQADKGVTPPLIDFDRSSNLLQVVDSTFYFFLKHADLKEIMDELPCPLES